MANGNIVNPIGCWKGTVELGDTTVKGSFEVFDSGGGWDFLFGKTLMTAFEAVHNYAVDEVLVPQHQLTLQNQHDIAKRHDAGRMSEAQNKEKKRETKKGDKAQSPVRGVPTNHINRELQTIDTHMIVTTLLDMEPQMQVAENPEESKHEIIVGDEMTSPPREVPATTSIKNEKHANESKSRRPSVEEVDDEESREHKAKEHKDKEKRASEERLKKQQSVEDEERQYLKKQAKERAKQMWTTWKGPSQRRHRRWKTRNTNIMRAKQEQAQGGIKEPPAREVPEHDSRDKTCPTDTTDEVFNQPTVAPVCIISEDTTETTADHTTEIPTDGLAKDTTNVFTRMTDPFKPARVEEIQRQVTIGNDLTSTENAQAQALITEFADIFALSVSEVKQVEGAVHRLNIDPNAKFSTKVHQKPLTPPQRRYLYEKLQAMLDADVIEPCEPGQVKCVSPTTLAQKTHEGAGLTLDELQHRVNDECVRNGLQPHFPLPPRPPPAVDDTEVKEDEPKWRICQNFSQINKVTQVAPMPQGDIRAKQQRLSGHRWVSTFDFTAGFYAVLVEPESRPYTAFYVEGWGYFWYKRMPFGLTGAPSTFAHMTGTTLI
jgi:hypothetical protein